MNLREALLQEHSKAQTFRIVNWIGADPKRFDQLIRLLTTDEYRVVQRAAWPLSYCAQHHPGLIKKHIKTLTGLLDQENLHPAVKRNLLRIFQDIPIPEQFHGRWMDACFRFAASRTEPAAIKAFSLTILQNLSAYYPEIIPEIKLIIEDRWDQETPAFKSRARKFLQSVK